MREYIDAINKLYQDDLSTLTEALSNASEYEIDLILESMDAEDAANLGRKLMEFDDVDERDFGLMTKIGAKIFGSGWASDKLGALQAMKDQEKFNSEWKKFSTRFNLQLTVDNLKKFAKAQWEMSPETADKALAEVKPKVDRKGVIQNIQDIIPALSYQYFMGMGDAIEKRAEEKHIDIDNLGYEQLPQNQSKFKPTGNGGNTEAGDNETAQDGEDNKQQGAAKQEDPGSLTGSQISAKMGKVLSSLHISTSDRQQAINDAKKGFTQSFSKNSRTLAALGYSYLKAVDAIK